MGSTSTLIAPPRSAAKRAPVPACAPAPEHEVDEGGSLARGVVFGLIAVLPFWLAVLWAVLRLS